MNQVADHVGGMLAKYVEMNPGYSAVWDGRIDHDASSVRVKIGGEFVTLLHNEQGSFAASYSGRRFGNSPISSIDLSLLSPRLTSDFSPQPSTHDWESFVWGSVMQAEHELRHSRPCVARTIDPLDPDALLNVNKGLVYIVNGRGGCTPCVCRDLRDWLTAAGYTVFDANWNDVNMQRPEPDTDVVFVQQMTEILRNYGGPVALVGHSFGGDSILKVAGHLWRPATSDVFYRHISVLAVIDGCGFGGVRTSVPVMTNVSTFINRYTENSYYGVAVNASSSGAVASGAPNTSQDWANLAKDFNGNNYQIDCHWYETCRTKTERLAHGGADSGYGDDEMAIYKDLWVQREIYERIKSM